MTNEIKLWKKHKSLDVVSASFLAVNADPHSYEKHWQKDELIPKEFRHIFDMLKKEIKGEIIPAKLEHYSSYSIYDDGDGINWTETTILFEDMKKFLENIDYKESFIFFEHPDNCNNDNIPPHANKNHPFYSKELHACIDAWYAIHEDPQLLYKKQPKQAIQEWLKTHGENYNLKKGFENNNELMERTSQVTNWKKSKSETYTTQKLNDLKTQIQNTYNKGTPLQLKTPPIELLQKHDNNQELDDDIPF